MQTRTLRIDGDLDVSVLEAGGPDRAPGTDDARCLLLVHGFTGAKEDFADHLDAIASLGWWVVAPDLRGHGETTAPTSEDAYSLGHFARDVGALVDALGWDRHVLLGHSMGGMVAQVVAIEDPDRLEGLVLMDTAHGPVSGIDPEVALLGAALARDGGMTAVKDALDGLGDDAPLGSEAYERVCRERPGHREFGDRKLLASSPSMYAAMIAEMVSQEDRFEALAGLDVATLVMVGEEDVGFLGPSARMADAIPDARHVVLPDAGHSPQFENPNGWFEALESFLAELTRR